jgi:hypothetical protein
MSRRALSRTPLRHALPHRFLPQVGSSQQMPLNLCWSVLAVLLQSSLVPRSTMLPGVADSGPAPVAQTGPP